MTTKRPIPAWLLSHRFLRRQSAFSLVELMVSMAVLGLVLMITLGIVDQVRNVYSRSTQTISVFQQARAGFETITRKLAQATLNTYWDYEYPGGDTSLPPERYVRQSELHFISGPANDLLPNTKAISHAIFFQAPLGYSDSVTGRNHLDHLLNASGFFVEYRDDRDDRPFFLRDLLPSRKRYRLMELWQPTEQFGVYAEKSGNDWLTEPVEAGNASPLADNVIVLVLWAKRSIFDPAPPLTNDFTYDTRRYQSAPNHPMSGLTRNQLPPIVHVTMVALDETSAARLDERYGDSAELLQPGALFSPTPGTPVTEEQIKEDLSTLETFLIEEHLNYRILSTDITIHQAKWSEDTF